MASCVELKTKLKKMELTEERVKVKILKATLSKSKLGYAKDALDYINILEKELAIQRVSQQRELFVAMFDKMTNDDIQECTNGFAERVFNTLSNQ